MSLSDREMGRCEKGAWGIATGLLRRPDTEASGDCTMVIDNADPNATKMDYPAHERNYSGFIKLFKWGTIASAIIAAIVVAIIAN